MRKPRTPTLKRYRVGVTKIKRAQKALQTTTEIHTIERALDLVISENNRNRLAARGHDRFLKRKISIRDI